MVTALTVAGAALPEKLGQVLAGYVLEDQIGIATLFTSLVDGHDVRMAHAPDRPRASASRA